MKTSFWLGTLLPVTKLHLSNTRKQKKKNKIKNEHLNKGRKSFTLQLVRAENPNILIGECFCPYKSQNDSTEFACMSWNLSHEKVRKFISFTNKGLSET